MTDEENAQYNRMCIAVLVAEEMLRAKDAELAQMRVKLARAESILRGNGGYWASQALEALRGC